MTGLSRAQSIGWSFALVLVIVAWFIAGRPAFMGVGWNEWNVAGLVCAIGEFLNRVVAVYEQRGKGSAS